MRTAGSDVIADDDICSTCLHLEPHASEGRCRLAAGLGGWPAIFDREGSAIACVDYQDDPSLRLTPAMEGVGPWVGSRLATERPYACTREGARLTPVLPFVVDGELEHAGLIFGKRRGKKPLAARPELGSISA